MKITGIIAEYNPFHNGHAYQIAVAKAAGATHIVCVMSGNFTQRGDAAMMDKLARTRCALAAGADLVLELPVVYSLSSAPDFARGAVDTLLAAGCIDALHFGSECGSTEALKEAAAAIELLEAKHRMDPKTNTPAASRGIALAENGFAKEAALLESPNNLLGIEYLLMLRRRYSHILPETVRRTGAAHDSTHTAEGVCSASQLRRMLGSDPNAAETYWPAACADIFEEQKKNGRAPVTLKQLEIPLLSRLRMAEPPYLARIAGVSEGLENRLYEAIRAGSSFEEICAAVKTRRYPLSRIRRILLCAAIGITARDAALAPAYVRVLGQNEKGNEVLRVMRQTARLPVIVRASDFEKVSPEGKRLFKLENLAADLYTMAYSPMGACGSEYTRNIYSYTKGEGCR